MKMKKGRLFFRWIAVLVLASCAASCATAQDKGKPMLIDKIPTNFYDPQVLIEGDKYHDQQEAMIRGMNEQLKGRYRVVAQRFYDLASYDQIHGASWAALTMSIEDTMRNVAKAKREYISPGAEDPNLWVWKADGEYVVIAMSIMPNHNTLLGYFELEKQ